MVFIKPIPERKNTNPKLPNTIIGFTGLLSDENSTAVYIKKPTPNMVKTAPKIRLIFIFIYSFSK